MNRVEMGIGTTQVLQNGVEVTTRPLIDIQINKPDIVDLSEAGHVVLNPWNIRSVQSNLDNGVTYVKKIDPEQLAAHSHGNGHDMRLALALGIDYDKMASKAASDLSSMKDKQFYFAGYLNANKGREISRAEALSVLDSYEYKDSVEITVNVGGEEASTVVEGDGEHVIVDFESISKNTGLDTENLEENEEEDTESSQITLYPYNPESEESLKIAA